jgi:hypothetical protein
MKRFAVRFHDDSEFQPQADCLSWLSDRAFRGGGSHAGRLFSQVFMIHTLALGGRAEAVPFPKTISPCLRASVVSP